MATRCITFLSDFGNSDTYVAEVKAVLIGAGKQISIVDLTHENPAFDIEWAAFQLLRSYAHFPKETIHLAIVDPGVGSARKPIYVRTKHFHFVGPDNGILKWAVEDAAKKEKVAPRIFEIPASDRLAPTFHGRDLFAPFIARLLKGKRSRLKRMETMEGESFPQAEKILGFDHYGNAVTTVISSREMKAFEIEGIAEPIRPWSHYQAIPSGAAGIIRGSHGFWEIAVKEGSAKERLRLQRGLRVIPRGL